MPNRLRRYVYQMHFLVYLRRTYRSSLPPTVFVDRLQQAVPPRPAGLLWWLRSLYLPCQGQVVPATNFFRAHMRWGRSNEARIKGKWQAASAISSYGGTTIQLIIHPPWSKLLFGYSLELLIIVSRSKAEPVFWAPLVLPGVMAILWTVFSWGDVSHAERYFQETLQLRQEASSSYS